MMRLRRRLVLLATAALTALTMTVPTTLAAQAQATAPPTIIKITAGHHVGFDRVTYTFANGLPTERSWQYVPQLIADPSGKPIPIEGHAIIRVRFFSAATTVTGTLTPRLPEVREVEPAGDFEGVVSSGIGITKAEPVTMHTLTSPSRVYFDVRTPPAQAAAQTAAAQQRQIGETTLSNFKVVLTATRVGTGYQATVTAAGYRNTSGHWVLVSRQQIGDSGQWFWYSTEVCGLTVTQLKPLPSSAETSDTLTVSLLMTPALGCHPDLTVTWPAPATTAAAQTAASGYGHVILKAGGGTIALATTGQAGSLVYAGRYRASNRAEDWGADHVPGGRFGLFWDPGHQTDDYVSAATSAVRLWPEGPGTHNPPATLFRPASGTYAPLATATANGSLLYLTYLGSGGKLALRPLQGPHGTASASQLWWVQGA